LWSANAPRPEEEGLDQEAQILEISIYQDEGAESRVVVLYPNGTSLSYLLTWGTAGRVLTTGELDRIINDEMAAVAGMPQLTVIVREQNGHKDETYIGRQIGTFSFYGMNGVARLIAEVLKRDPPEKELSSAPDRVRLSVQSLPEVDPNKGNTGFLRSDSFFPGLASVGGDVVPQEGRGTFPEESERTRRGVTLRFENKSAVPLSVVVDNPWQVVGMMVAIGLTQGFTKPALAEVSKITNREEVITIPQVKLQIGKEAKVVLNGSVSSRKGLSAHVEMEFKFP